MSRKGKAKRRKSEMLRNKKFVKRYPWIAPIDWFGNRVKEYSFARQNKLLKKKVFMKGLNLAANNKFGIEIQ